MQISKVDILWNYSAPAVSKTSDYQDDNSGIIVHMVVSKNEEIEKAGMQRNPSKEEIAQEIEKRAHNRTKRPGAAAFRKFIGEDWGPRPTGPQRSPVADYLPARHTKLGRQFIGERLVFPAGDLQVRSNDTDYRFRAHSAFSHLSGLGQEDEPGAVLILEPIPGADGANDCPTHEATLYFHPRTSRSAEEFWADSRHGEFWVGARLSAADMSTLTGLKVAHIEDRKSVV